MDGDAVELFAEPVETTMMSLADRYKACREECLQSLATSINGSRSMVAPKPMAERLQVSADMASDVASFRQRVADIRGAIACTLVVSFVDGIRGRLPVVIDVDTYNHRHLLTDGDLERISGVNGKNLEAVTGVPFL